MAIKDEASSDKYHLLEEPKKLFWKEAESNLIQWEEDIIEALKAQFSIYAECIIQQSIPREWTHDYVYDPDDHGGIDYDSLRGMERKILDLQIAEYYNVQFIWANKVKRKMIPFIAKCCKASSINRCKSTHKNEFEAAIKNDDPVEYYKIIKLSHTFRGKAASTAEITGTIALASNFPYTAPDKLPEFKKKWDDMFDKRFKNLGITMDQVSAKTRMFSFAQALKSYPHSDMVKLTCIQVIAHLDETNANHDIETFYNELVLYQRKIQNATIL